MNAVSNRRPTSYARCRAEHVDATTGCGLRCHHPPAALIRPATRCPRGCLALRTWLGSRSGRRPRSVARRGGLRLVTQNPGVLEDRVSSDRRCGRGVNMLPSWAQRRTVNLDLKVEGRRATADFAATTCLTLCLRGSRHSRRSRQHICLANRGRRVRGAGSECGRGHLSGQRGGRPRRDAATQLLCLKQRRGSVGPR